MYIISNAANVQLHEWEKENKKRYSNLDVHFITTACCLRVEEKRKRKRDIDMHFIAPTKAGSPEREKEKNKKIM